MKTEPSQTTVLICDNGLFAPLAARLAQSFKRVLYTTNRRKGFALINECVIGDGIENVDRIDDYWLPKYKNEVDLFIFPDIEDAGPQLELESQGKLVWGSRLGDSLETNREKFLRVLSEVGLEVPKFERVVGLAKLREHLRDAEDKYVKISKFRGSLETTHWRNWRQDEGLLDFWAVKLGPTKDRIPFLVFDNIETDLEIGGDTFSIDGQFPERVLNGLEFKDKGFLSSVTERKDMPEHIQDVMSAFAPILAEYRYRNFWSMEVRVKDDVGYFIDPCCRFPCPASASQLALIENLPEVLLAGAQGELIEPEWRGQVSAECVLTQHGEHSIWSAVDFDPALKPHLFCGGSCEIDGRICSPPNDSHDEAIGWLVTIGDSIEDAVGEMKRLTELLPDGVSAKTDSLYELLKEAAEAEDIPFGDAPLPEPEIALDGTS